LLPQQPASAGAAVVVYALINAIRPPLPPLLPPLLVVARRSQKLEVTNKQDGRTANRPN